MQLNKLVNFIIIFHVSGMAVVSDKIDQIMPHCVLTSIMRICHAHCTNTLGFQDSEQNVTSNFENKIKTKLTSENFYDADDG